VEAGVVLAVVSDAVVEAGVVLAVVSEAVVEADVVLAVGVVGCVGCVVSSEPPVHRHIFSLGWQGHVVKLPKHFVHSDGSTHLPAPSTTGSQV
jgi:hypothetical protein